MKRAHGAGWLNDGSRVQNKQTASTRPCDSEKWTDRGLIEDPRIELSANPKLTKLPLPPTNPAFALGLISHRAIVLWSPRYVDTGKQTLTESCPGTATYRSLRFLHLAAMVPSAGTIII
jgi:hypothetical protein